MEEGDKCRSDDALFPLLRRPQPQDRRDGEHERGRVHRQTLRGNKNKGKIKAEPSAQKIHS